MSILTRFHLYSFQAEKTAFEVEFNNRFLTEQQRQIRTDEYGHLLALRKQIKKMEQSIHELKEIALVNSSTTTVQKIESLETNLKNFSLCAGTVLIRRNQTTRNNYNHSQENTKRAFLQMKDDLERDGNSKDIKHLMNMLTLIFLFSALAVSLSIILFNASLAVGIGFSLAISLLELKVYGLALAVTAVSFFTLFLANNAYYDVRFLFGQQVNEIDEFMTFLDQDVYKPNPSDKTTPNYQDKVIRLDSSVYQRQRQCPHHLREVASYKGLPAVPS